jgi:hypothetical protein
VSHLLDDSLYKKDVIKMLDTGKVVASMLLAIQEGMMNLNAIIGHVLAIGPGMLISAWTAKLIFAHSTIPAYFCYFFPWVYSPMAWALYNIFYQIIPDMRLFTGLAILSFWPIIMAVISLRYGLHRQMRTGTLMHVVNMLLVIYYGMLLVAYACLASFAFSYHPEGDDYINEGMRGKWNIGNWIYERVHSVIGEGVNTKQLRKDTNFLFLWLMDSFATFFFTCCAVTDAFIVMISQEHNEAWLMHHQTVRKANAFGPDESRALDRTFGPEEEEGLDEAMQQYYIGTRLAIAKEGTDGIRFVYEEEVIKDWLLLIHDVQVKVPQESPPTLEKDAATTINESFGSGPIETQDNALIV